MMWCRRLWAVLVVVSGMAPRVALSADSLVLVISSGNEESRLLEEGFASELGLTMDTYRVERRALESAGFSSMSPDEKIAIAGRLLTEANASAVIWLESQNDAVTGIGLYVTVSQLHLARMVTFDSSIDFLPDVALITSGLIEHALAYGQQTDGTGGAGGSELADADTNVPGDNGMGRRIPVPDGWLLVSQSPSPRRDRRIRVTDASGRGGSKSGGISESRARRSRGSRWGGKRIRSDSGR